MYISIKSYFMHIHVYLYYLCLCTFVYGSICMPLICVYLHLKSMKVLCLSAFVSSLSTCLPLYNLTFTDSAQINLLLSVISIITLLVKLLQMILGYVTSFEDVSLSIPLSISSKDTYLTSSYHNGSMSHKPRFSETQSSSYYS